MKIIEENENNRINSQIALQLAQIYFEDIDKEQLINNATTISKEYKKFVVKVMESIEEYDTSYGISVRDLSI